MGKLFIKKEDSNEKSLSKKIAIKLFICIITIISTCIYGLGSSYAASNLQISIYAGINAKSASASSGLGDSHAWIVIKNLGNPIKIGTYNLGTNKSLTMGLFGNTSRKGIWYNKEANDRGLYQNNSNTVYLISTVSHSKISAIEEVMKNNNYWGLLHNCTHFAVKVWNASGAPSIDTSADPASLRSRIMSKSGYKTGNTHSNWVNANTDEKWYSINAISSTVSNKEILSRKIIDDDRVIYIKEDKLIFIYE